jgi:hypothetical protein
MVDDDLRAGRLRALLTRWETRIYPIQAVLPPGRAPLPKTRAFVDFLVDVMRRAHDGLGAPLPQGPQERRGAPREPREGRSPREPPT